LQPLQNLPAASQVDPRRLFPRPSARDCPRMAASRICRPARANRRETRRDAAHRQSGVRARRPPHRPPPRTVTAPPTRPALLFLRAAARISHEPIARANRRQTHRDAAHRRSAVRAAATHRQRAPDATPRPPAPPFCSTRAAARPHEPMPPEPIDGRRTAPVAAPRPCSAPVCRRSAKALGTPLPRALSASAERPWFASASENAGVTPGTPAP